MTEPMPLPDITYATLPVPVTADLTAIYQAVALIAGCGPRTNALGNIQSVHRIGPDGQGAYTLTYPAAANQTDVQAVITAHS